VDLKHFKKVDSDHHIVKFINYASRIGLCLIFFESIDKVWIAVVASMLYLLLIHPIAWMLGEKFRDFTHPTSIISSSALGTFRRRIFWMFGPQLISSIIFVFLVTWIAEALNIEIYGEATKVTAVFSQ
jgi:hypothetical protein